MYDEDSVGSDFLGEYRLKLSTIRADVKEAYSIYLQNKTEVSTLIHPSIEPSGMYHDHLSSFLHSP